MMILKRYKLKEMVHGLRTQLVIFFTAITMIVFALSSYFSYTTIANFVQQRNEQMELQQFPQIEDKIDTFMKEVDRVSIALLTESRTLSFFDQTDLSDAQYVDMLNNLFDSMSTLQGNYSYIESIYLFSEDGQVAGVLKGRNYQLKKDTKKHWFYNSEDYRLAMERYPELIWTGAYISGNFESVESSDNNGAGSIRLISAIRGMKSKYNNKLGGTLVLNINEKTFASLYNSHLNSEEVSSSIIDSSGLIISSEKSSDIGKQSALYSRLEKDKAYGSLILDSSTNQAVYYRMRKSGWILIDEVPLNTITKDTQFLQRIVLISYFVSMLIIFVVTFFWIEIITKPLKHLTRKMKDMSNGKLGLTLSKPPKNEIGVVIEQFNEMSVNIHDLIIKNEEIEKKKRRLEIETLQAQINPHFLYNTLNAIKWMAAIKKQRNIVESLTTLGNIIRPIYNSTDIMCSIFDEIEYEKNYIKIMNLRYGEGVKVEFDIPEALKDCRILRFILQPLIENSFVHGIKKNNYIGIIRIQAMEHQDYIVLIVSDSGIGIEAEKLEQLNKKLVSADAEEDKPTENIGLSNVNQRIKLHFGDHYGINIESTEGQGTRIFLRIPTIVY